MSQSPHIVILGAGLIGLSSADALLRRGARVTVVERGAAVMRGASFANSGMIHPSQACSWSGGANEAAADAAVQALALRSLDIMQAYPPAIGLDAMAQRAPGCLQVFEQAADADLAFSRLNARGIAVEARQPSTGTFDRHAIFFPDDRSGDARLYGEALARAVAELGGDIRLGVDPVDLYIANDGHAALRIGDESLEPDGIVVACGAQSANALAAVGITLPVTPVRGWSIDYARPEGIALPDAPVMDAVSRSALTVFSDRLRLSGTWGDDSEAPLLARWRRLAPDLMAALGAPLQVWSGLRPVSALGRPFIGAASIPGLWVNAGHGHMGWTLCAGSGALMAEMICGVSTDSRFSLEA